jgi:hypothetical protein
MLRLMPLEIGQGGYPDPDREKNHTEKTINHTFCKCIAKMANLSQYCTPFGTVYSLSVKR